jgi:hypothetical protein
MRIPSNGKVGPSKELIKRLLLESLHLVNTYPERVGNEMIFIVFT